MRRTIKKFIKVFMLSSYTLVTMIAPMTVIALDPPVLRINGISGVDIQNRVTFHNEEDLSGKVCVRYVGTSDCLNPILNMENHTATFNLTSNNIKIDVLPSEGFFIDHNQYSINSGGALNVPDNKTIDLNFTASINIFDISFTDNNNSGEIQQNGTIIKLQKPQNNILEIDSIDTNKVNYKLGNIVVGSAKVRVGSTYVTPSLDEKNNGSFDVDDYTNSEYKAYVELTTETGYSLEQFYHIDGTQFNIPNNNEIEININNNREFIVDFQFVQGAQSNSFPLVAYFENVLAGQAIIDNHVLLPEGFTTGDITFKTSVCDAPNGSVIPNDGNSNCTNPREIPVRIEGVANGNQLNNTVRGNHQKLEILSGFEKYGKASLHLVKVNETDPEINSFIDVITEDLINIKAESPIWMSYSLGSSSIDQAILTNTNKGNVSIFFGNNETTLKADGIKVDKITKVTGGKSVRLNNDGTATIELPELSKETTTTVEVSILLYDGTTIKKTIDIARTAIMLQHNYGENDNSVYAGYVANKGYLYNNLSHNDEIFNAYLQVILYKDDVVVGYKQIKIDDKKLIDDLHNNESGSLEIYSDKQIPIYGKATNDLENGVNRVSVFLTNGPVDFNKNLPSIEFGIGSGVTLEWGAK